MQWDAALRRDALLWRQQVVGVDQEVLLLDGSRTTYANLDNAATTPVLGHVQQAVREAEATYASVHRGSGYKSRRTSDLYEEARAQVLRFVGAQDGSRVAIFTKHTTEAVNKLAAEFPFEPGDVVILTEMEHHANLLPWRGRAELAYLPVEAAGRLKLAALPDLLERYRGRVRLVALSGASNVTGYLNDIHWAAEVAHRHGARIFVDAAQRASHLRMRMLDPSDPRAIDFLAFSGHKIYAPYGAGVLIGPQEFFRHGEPAQRGGGAIRFVSLDEVIWDDPPAREEAGSPNVLGAIALGAALHALEMMGLERIQERERSLLAYLLDRLGEVPGLQVLGSTDREERVGAVSFIMHGVPPMLVAAALGWEWGIGVRAGCFCANPYVMRLLGLSQREVGAIRDGVAHGQRRHMPGAVRASLGLYSTEEEIDRLHDALLAVRLGEFRGRYAVEDATGEYWPEGAEEAWSPL